jgi:hypothetical protein
MRRKMRKEIGEKIKYFRACRRIAEKMMESDGISVNINDLLIGGCNTSTMMNRIKATLVGEK